MKPLTPDELRTRLSLDYRVAQDMFGPVFRGEAYRTATDLEHKRNPITTLGDSHLATKYRVDFFVRTLIGPGQFSDVTTISFDLDQPNYPASEPATQVLSSHIPYSPHFMQGAPVCLGEIWERGDGRMLLGQLFVHIAKLLNWDEAGRHPVYVGWNGEAIAYHARVYGGKALNPQLHYPLLPDYIHGVSAYDPYEDLARMFAPRSQANPQQ